MAKVLAWPPVPLLWEASRTFHHLSSSGCGICSNHSGFPAKRLAALSATASAASLAPISTAFCVALASTSARSSPEEPQADKCKAKTVQVCGFSFSYAGALQCQSPHLRDEPQEVCFGILVPQSNGPLPLLNPRGRPLKL